MAYDYDKLYRSTPNALGAPTPVIEQFMSGLPHKIGRLLDVGCGQGRDALFLARLGFQVEGVDISPSGVKDMLAAAKQEGLSIKGHVQDIRSFQPNGDFDIILADRTLHMLAEADRLSVLVRLLDSVKENGWLVIADEPKNIVCFRDVLSNHSQSWAFKKTPKAYLFAQKI